jgi:hypothetical protein
MVKISTFLAFLPHRRGVSRLRLGYNRVGVKKEDNVT